jgi:predicted RNase H-like HicB family nuclease
MRFEGRVSRDGKWWLAEVPILDAMTQGKTKDEAFAMAGDLVESLVGREGFKVTIDRLPGDRFVLGANDTGALIALLLRRQRQRAGLSLAKVSRAMGARSRNAYARYERGTSVPTIEKLSKLLEAVAPGHAFVLDQVA